MSERRRPLYALLAFLAVGFLGLYATWHEESALNSSERSIALEAPTGTPAPKKTKSPTTARGRPTGKLTDYLSSRDYLVLQSDNRLGWLLESDASIADPPDDATWAKQAKESRVETYRVIRTDYANFSYAPIGPSILSTLKWAETLGYAHLYVDTRSSCWEPYHKFKIVHYWCKVPEMLRGLYLARRSGMKGMLFVDSDAGPDNVIINPKLPRHNYTIEDLLQGVERDEGKPRNASDRHVFVALSRGGWEGVVKKEDIYYRKEKGVVNTGALFFRTTDQAWDLLVKWWFETTQVKSPREAWSAQVLRIHGEWLGSDAEADGIEPLARRSTIGVAGQKSFSLTSNQADYRKFDVRLSKFTNATSLETVRARLCDPAWWRAASEKRHQLMMGGGAAAAAAVAASMSQGGAPDEKSEPLVKITHCPEVKYTADFTTEWPGDQERMQWLIAEDPRVWIPMNPCVGMEDTWEPKLIYHWSKSMDTKRFGAKSYARALWEQSGSKTDWAAWNDRGGAWEELKSKLRGWRLPKEADQESNDWEILAKYFDSPDESLELIGKGW